ncbi:uncharacterized protein LOC144113703 isoform X5 [Amblyomma americanum]
MSPAETKKTKRRKNKKVARPTGKEQIEGVGMSAGVGSANPCIGQSAKDAGVHDLTLSVSPACGPKELQGCILCSRAHSTDSATEHTKDAVDIFGPEAVWDSLPSDALCSSDALFSEDIDLSSALRDGTFPKELLSLADDCGSSVCVCERYSNWKALEPEADQQELLCWQVVKQALHRKYQRAGLGSEAVPPLQDDQPLPSDAEVRAMVSRLRRRDPQHLLQCLKYQAQLFVVESRLRMLRQLVTGPRLADALVAEYAKLRLAWEGLDPLLEELQVLPAQWMSPSWKPVDPDLVAKNLGQCCRSLLAGELQQEGCNSALEQRQCCLATASGMVCPFAETRPSVLAAGEPSSTSPLSQSPVLPGAAWGHGGDTCGPGLDSQSSEASLPKKAAETCECHACTQMPWNPQSLLQLYGSRPLNLDLDSLDSLPQLRDWEDGHFKSRHTSTDLSPQPAPPGTTSPQSSSTPARRHSEPGTCLDSDCDNALVDGEDSLDDSCSEHSSSTTASNQRSAGENRVCDCCYCEVFGHGAPPVAPVSKNYQEMRDRLRLILSKRKAEAIHMAKQRPQQHHHQERHEDDREVEELLSYINGTDSGGSRKESAHVTMDANVTSTTSSPGVKGTVTKRHKRKTKRREDLDKVNKAIEIKVHSAPVISRLVEDAEESKVPSSPKAVVNRKEARKENGVRLSKCPKSNGASTNGSSCIASIHELNEECPPPEVSLCNRVTSSTMISTLSNSRVPATAISGNVFIIGRPTLPSETGSMLDEETVSKMTIGDVELSVTSTTLSSNNVLKTVCQDRQASMPEASSSCNHRQSRARDQLSEAKKQLCITHHLNGTQTASKNKKSRKKKNSSADVTSPDEVFLPKDIDLENGDLDELEREVEAFKRFCFNSVPVANKEKVHVNLKDILLRRKQTSTTVIPAGLLQRT